MPHLSEEEVARGAFLREKWLTHGITDLNAKVVYESWLILHERQLLLSAQECLRLQQQVTSLQEASTTDLIKHREERDALAAALDKLGKMLKITAGINPSLKELLNISADPTAILAAHDAAVRRKVLEEAAEKIVDAIIADLDDRRGLKSEWRSCDPEIQQEIRETWVKMAREVKP